MDSIFLRNYLLQKEVGKDNFSLSIFERDEEIANITCFLNKNCVYIHTLYSKKPGERLGTFLMSKMCDHIFRFQPNIDWVELDDSTGVNPPKNIYYKLGFKVKDDKSMRYVSWNTWLSRYSKTKNNPSEERRINLYTLNLNLQRYLFS